MLIFFVRFEQQDIYYKPISQCFNSSTELDVTQNTHTA